MVVGGVGISIGLALFGPRLIKVGAIFGVGFLREWLDSKETGEKQKKLQVEVEKQRTIKVDLDACTNENPAKKLELIDSHKAQKKE